MTHFYLPTPESLVRDAVWCSEAYHVVDCHVWWPIKPLLATISQHGAPSMTPCRIPTFYSPASSRDLLHWVRLALPENGTPSVVVINVVWNIHCLTSECLI